MKKVIIKTLFFTLLLTPVPFVMPAFAMSADIYTNAQTGIILPNEIVEHKMIGKTVYDEKELGESVSFKHEDATATVYIYDYNRNDIKDDSRHSLIVKELSSSIGVIKKLQEMGYYDDVEIEKKGRITGKDGYLVFISIPVTYNAIKSSETGKKIPRQAINSMITIGIYKNHFIKIRYSFSQNEEVLKKRYEQRDAFIGSVRKLILEVDLRKKIKELIGTYLKDPFTEEGKKALGTIVAYAQMSELVNITLNSEIAPWLKVKDYPYGHDLLGAYIVGQVNYQISSNHFESNQKAGMDQVLQVYKLLKNKDKKATIPILEEQLKK